MSDLLTTGSEAPTAGRPIGGALERVRQATASERVWVLAVSGGADSLALLRGACALPADGRPEIVVAHLNHQLRAEAEGDARWVAGVCERLGVPCVVESADVTAYSVARQLGVEEAARRVRYRFLERVARDRGALSVLTAHHRDDQVETILHHILRGTSLAGLAGMRATRTLPGGVVLRRPLLEISRGEIEAFLAELKQEFLTDRTNADTDYTRNRLRNVLLPWLEREFNPQVREHLLSLARQAGAWSELGRSLARDVLREAVVEQTPSRVVLRRDVLARQPDVLLGECFAALWHSQEWPRQDLATRHFETLIRLTRQPATTTLPGRIAVRSSETLVELTRSE